MSAIGSINVHAYVSNAQIPLKDVTVAITDPAGEVIALRLTNRSGELDSNIEIQVPDLSESQRPNAQQTPYKTVDIYARAKDYEQIHVQNVQVFPNTVTLQNLEMIPLSEFPENRSKSETFITSSQNL